MRTAWLLFRKDARRFRVLIGVWLGVLALASLHEAAGFPALPAFGWTPFIGLGRWFVCGMLVVILIHEDRLVGDREFWMGRPIAPASLALAKLGGLFVWLVLPAVVAHTLQVAWLGAGPRQLLVAAAGALAFVGGLVGAIAAIAAVTARSREWLIAAVVLCLGFAAVVSWPALQGLGHALYAPMRAHGDRAVATSFGMAAMVFGCGVVLCQALFRRLAWSAALILLGAATIWDAVVLWPFPVRRADFPAGSRPALRVEPLGSPLRSAVPTGYGQPRSHLVAGFRILNSDPECFYALQKVDSRYPGDGDGRVWAGSVGSGLPPSNFGVRDLDEDAGNTGSREAALRRALGLAAGGATNELFAELWAGPDAGFPAGSSALRSQLSLAEYRVSLATELPFREGAWAHVGGRVFRIAEIRRPDQKSTRNPWDVETDLEVRLLRFGRRMPYSTLRFFLLNRGRGEARLGAALNASSFTSPGSTVDLLDVQRQRLVFSLPPPASAFERDAVLVAVNYESLGSVKIPVTLGPWSAPSGR